MNCDRSNVSGNFLFTKITSTLFPFNNDVRYPVVTLHGFGLPAEHTAPSPITISIKFNCDSDNVPSGFQYLFGRKDANADESSSSTSVHYLSQTFILLYFGIRELQFLQIDSISSLGHPLELQQNGELISPRAIRSADPFAITCHLTIALPTGEHS